MSKFNLLVDNEIESCEYTLVIWPAVGTVVMEFYDLERALLRSGASRVERRGLTLEVDINTDLFKHAQIGREIAFECTFSDRKSSIIRFKIKEMVRGPRRNWVTLDHVVTVPMPE